MIGVKPGRNPAVLYNRSRPKIKRKLYILALISLNNALSLSISVSFAGQLIPNPSSGVGFGIYFKSALLHTAETH